MDAERVVVTGAGVVTALGSTLADFWTAVVAGRSAFSPQVAPQGEVWGAALPAPFGAAQRRARGAALHVAHAAVKLAGLQQATHEAACVFGGSKGDAAAWSRAVQQRHDPAVDDWLDCWPSAAGQAIQHALGMHGPAEVPVAACATGVASLAQGFRWLQWGLAPWALTGAVDASWSPAVLGAFQRMGVLWTGPPGPAQQPFGRQRRGFLLGEGAAALVLEPRWRATARGAVILAEVLAAMEHSDPAGMTTVTTTGETVAALVHAVLRQARCSASDIDAIVVHGTGTPANDVAEARGIARVWPDAARRPPCVALKGGWGHLLGAAGAVELVATCLMLQHQVLPPCAMTDDLDPDCPVRLTGPRAIETPLRHVLKLSLGFGGHLAAAVLRRP